MSGEPLLSESALAGAREGLLMIIATHPSVSAENRQNAAALINFLCDQLAKQGAKDAG